MAPVPGHSVPATTSFIPLTYNSHTGSFADVTDYTETYGATALSLVKD